MPPPERAALAGFQFSRPFRPEHDLDRKDRWYGEVWGRYDYIKPVSIANGAGRAGIDAGSLGIGVGVGLRF